MKYSIDYVFFQLKNGLGHRVVHDLTRGLVHRGHHLYFDRLFTGVPLMVDLLDDGIHACGTVNTNRKVSYTSQK